MKSKYRPVLKDKSGQKIAPLNLNSFPDFTKELEEVRAMRLHPNLPPLAPPEDDDESSGTNRLGIRTVIAFCVICALSIGLVGLLLGLPFLLSLYAGTALSFPGLLFWLVKFLKRKR